MNDRYRQDPDVPPCTTQTLVDPIEREAVLAMKALRERFQHWAYYTPALSGSEIAKASESVGRGIAAIADAVVRLRQQKLGA